MANGDVHTTWDDDNKQWRNTREGNSRASSTHDHKDDASQRGQDLARNTGNEWLGHKRDGTINERNTYGDDPYPPRG